MAMASANTMIQLERTIGKETPAHNKQNGHSHQKSNEKNNLNSKVVLNDGKVFKRALYHVAIAYHIFLKGAGERGMSGEELDPTYAARKMKEQAVRGC
jgi:hypothetical protein